MEEDGRCFDVDKGRVRKKSLDKLGVRLYVPE